MSDRIAVIGAGQMGNGIVHVSAVAGHDVVMIDISQGALDKAKATIEKNLDRQVKKGALDEAAKADAMARIATSTSLDAVADAQFVIEAATENVDLKHKLFGEIDRLAPEGAILATNTSSISITEIAGRVKRPEAVIGMHFMNPVPVMQLVEVIRGLATSQETMDRTLALAKGVGKTPVEVNDYPGFVANRILLPMINEAVYCVMEGVGTPEAIDQVMKLGMNHPMGPLTLADFIGLDTCLAILEVMHKGLGDPKYRPCPLLRKYVAQGWLGRKAGRGFYSY
ncbi:MAG: 3-hydroxybutyryl-CoA dehydrogenase [Gemmatimonadota bacterium]|nr:3-hydroxybutyryl-CoA dehydrogenase [Gemmatimonadota bacterium]